MSHKVFISYASEDQATADSICATLEAQGIKCWIAHRDIMASAVYTGAIVEAIDASSILILLFSSNSNQSDNVRSELEIAFNNEKDIAIVPFRIEDVKPSKDMAYYLSATQWLNAFTPPLETHLVRLTETVKRLLEGPPSPRLPPPHDREGWKLTQSKAAIGIVLALSTFALWLFVRDDTGVIKGTSNTSNTTNATQANTSNNNLVTATNVNQATTNSTAVQPVTSNAVVAATCPSSTIEEQYACAIKKLDNKLPMPQRLHGIDLLGQIIKAANEDWYWRVMDQLTAYVRDEAGLEAGAGRAPQGSKEDIFAILKVIAAQPPAYPPDADDAYKRNKRRNLRGTDLRGLRLGKGAHLEYVDLSGARLDGANLREACLEGVNFYYASLVGAHFYGAYMRNVDFTGADINRADLSGTGGLRKYDIELAQHEERARFDLLDEARAKEVEEAMAKRCK